MTKYLAPIFLLLVWTSQATAVDCVPIDLPATSAGSDASKTFVRLQLVDPVNGAAVDADSTVVVDVEYRVADFQPGEFGLMFYFPALVSAISPFGPEGRYPLTRAAGRVRLCVPLREVYATSRLRWPLSMYVNLNRRKDNVSPKFTAMFDAGVDSAPVSLNSVRQPDENQHEQANAVTPAYREAVTRLMGIVVGAAAAGNTCADVPEVAVEFNAAHRGWTSRNAALIDYVRALQRDLYLRDMQRADVVDEVMNLHMTHVLNSLDQLTPAQLLSYCRREVQAFSNPRSDLETAAASQLAVLRTQGPERMPQPR